MCHPSSLDRADSSMEDKYDVHYNHILGEGSYATVFAATEKTSGEEVAVKAVNRK